MAHLLTHKVFQYLILITIPYALSHTNTCMDVMSQVLAYDIDVAINSTFDLNVTYIILYAPLQSYYNLTPISYHRLDLYNIQGIYALFDSNIVSRLPDFNHYQQFSRYYRQRRNGTFIVYP